MGSFSSRRSLDLTVQCAPYPDLPATETLGADAVLPTYCLPPFPSGAEVLTIIQCHQAIVLLKEQRSNGKFFFVVLCCGAHVYCGLIVDGGKRHM